MFPQMAFKLFSKVKWTHLNLVEAKTLGLRLNEGGFTKAETCVYM